MPTLLEKIEANADQRLSLPADRQPSEELSRYKKFLKVETHRLKMLHRAGGGGQEVCRARATMMDLLLKHILQAIQNHVDPKIDGSQRPFCLVALGGYGRSELNPHSDIDIMFLHDGDLVIHGKPRPYPAALIDGLLYTLWDVGLKVGHSVRSIEDCVKVANGHMQAKTSLIEARRILGDESLFARMQAVVLAKCVRGFEDAYIAARLNDQNARRAKFGNSACMLEPNIKNGCGGLRDYQNLLWMAWFKYRFRTLSQLEEKELLNGSEHKQLAAAYDFLLRVRTELHYHFDQAMDTLAKNAQPAVAHNLGYADRSPLRRLEQFMRDFYTHSRNIYLITRTVEQRLALLPHPEQGRSLRGMLRARRLQFRQQIVDGFKLLDGEIHPTSSRIFREQPRRLMRVFLLAQQRGLRIHPDLAQLIRQQLALVDRGFLHDSHVRDTFLEILNQRGDVAPVLREMHELGLLGKFIPEFGRLTCMVQHEFYHQYAADEHTLRCLEKIDQIWGSDKPPFNRYADMFQHLDRPFILYLALLLHDSGKAYRTGQHARVGGKLAVNVAKRLALDESTTATLRLLIENHLVMAQVSQRRDLDDPGVIRAFAAQVQSPENLDLLTLHTFGDSQATSTQFWTEFKDSLLRTLYQKTSALLRGGPEFVEAEAKKREVLASEIRALLPLTFNEEEITAHFENLPPRYFQIHSAAEIVLDLTLTHRFMHQQLAEAEQALEPIVQWHNEPDRGYTKVDICTWSRAGLFSKIAGAFTASGHNILSAEIFSRFDGIVLDTFFVTAAETGTLPNRQQRDKFEEILLQALNGEIDLGDLVRRQKGNPPVYPRLEGQTIPTMIEIDNSISENRTVIEVETEDRVGLLYAISGVLAGLSLDISVAKICTEKGAAIDSFYVSEEFGGQVKSPEKQRLIIDSLREAVQRLDSA